VRWFLGHEVPLYFSNSGTLNLDGIITSGTRHSPTASSNPWLLPPSMALSLSSRNSNLLLVSSTSWDAPWLVFCITGPACVPSPRYLWMNNCTSPCKDYRSTSTRARWTNIWLNLSWLLLAHRYAWRINKGDRWQLFLLGILLTKWSIFKGRPYGGHLAWTILFPWAALL